MSRKRPGNTPAVIDACCLIDLLASGRLESILQAAGYAWHMPDAVKDEVRFVRGRDPSRPGSYLNVPVDLALIVSSGILIPCQPTDAREQSLFVQYAARFRSDGEAMCLAIAEARGWVVATDDRKAIKLAQAAGLTVLSCPRLVKSWVEATKPDAAAVVQVLTDVETLAQFRPSPTMPESAWWNKRLSRTD